MPPVPHPFAFLLVKGWETTKLNGRNHSATDLVPFRKSGQTLSETAARFLCPPFNTFLGDRLTQATWSVLPVGRT